MRHIIWMLATCVISSPLHAQTVNLNIVQVLRHGEWNAIGLNNGSELRILFAPEDTGVLYAQVTVTRFFGAGPSTTLNFKGMLLATKAYGQAHGMPGSNTICGQLSNVGHTCFIVDGDFDGYIPGDNGSKLYNLVLRIKITDAGGNSFVDLVFDGVMRNPIPLKVAADGTIIW